MFVRLALALYFICMCWFFNVCKVMTAHAESESGPVVQLASLAPNGFTIDIAFDERTGIVLLAGSVRLQGQVDNKQVLFSWTAPDGQTYLHHISRLSGAMIVHYVNTSEMDTYQCSKEEKRF